MSQDRVRVLVIDDSAFNRRTIVKMLEDLPNVEVVGYACDGEEGLRKVIDLKPDLITLDLEMPRMNGMELTAHVRADEGIRDIPVIMVTSRSTDKHRQQAASVGVTQYVTKPYRDETLLQVIEQALA